MRKHKIRHILHGLLDLLPLFVIPVFMVYSHRHSIDNYSVTVIGAEYQLQQGVINGKPNTSNDINIADVEGYFQNMSFDNGFSGLIIGDFDESFIFDIDTFNDTDKYFVSLEAYVGNNEDCDVSLSFDIDYHLTTFSQKYFYIDIGLDASEFYLGFIVDHHDDTMLYYKNLQLFNLTQIFGSGNEPTAEEFSSFIGDTYYEYGQTYNVFLPYGTTTYNATDIGSQFIYSLYNVTENYFNTDSVFNLSSLHSWITNNFFNGNMPLGVTVVYHIIVYELIMDIIFLIYAVFMFIVDFASDFLEHCFTWSRRGGN